MISEKKDQDKDYRVNRKYLHYQKPTLKSTFKIFEEHMDGKVQSASSIITSDNFFKLSDRWQTFDPCHYSNNTKFPQGSKKRAEWIHLALQRRRDQKFLDKFLNAPNAPPEEFPQNTSLQVLRKP